MSVIPCAYCGDPAVNIGTFGRHKFACSNYVSRSRSTTDDCDGGQKRISYHEEWFAESDWNRLQYEVLIKFPQGFSDPKGSGVRNGPVHLFGEKQQRNEWDATALCGRRCKQWNFEGETEEDFCPRCVKASTMLRFRVVEALP